MRRDAARERELERVQRQRMVANAVRPRLWEVWIDVVRPGFRLAPRIQNGNSDVLEKEGEDVKEKGKDVEVEIVEDVSGGDEVRAGGSEWKSITVRILLSYTSNISY